MFIKSIVHDARYIVGLGPITSEDIENASGDQHSDKVRNAAINFMRKNLSITRDEIKNNEVVETFLPDDPSIPRVYARLVSHAHVDFIIEVVRSLRKKELKVVKQFRTTNRSLVYLIVCPPLIHKPVPRQVTAKAPCPISARWTGLQTCPSL